MKSILNVTYRTLAPLAHGGFGPATGNSTTIRREPLVTLPGAPLIPVVSGNAVRGVVRRTIMRNLFARLGLGPGELPDRQWDLLYAALANGGHLTGKEATPSPETIRELRATLPPLSVLGSAMYRYLLPGWSRFGFVWPVCAETIEGGIVDADDVDVPMAGDIVVETSVVRHVDRDQQDPDVTGVTPMPVTVEAIGTGVELRQKIRFSAAAGRVERSAIAWALDRIDYLGGKSGSGFGEVSISHDGDAEPYQSWLDGLDVDATRVFVASLAKSIA